MKKLLVLMLAVIMVLLMAACGGQEAELEQTPEKADGQASEQTPEAQPDWEYDASSNALFVNADMGDFEPDAPDFEGTTSNAPWAEFLPEIENIVVGDDVTFIGDYAFAFCSSLKSVEVAQNVADIGFRSFFKCSDWENDSDVTFSFDCSAFPMFDEDVFGWTWDNSNAVVYVREEFGQEWANYLGNYPMYVQDFDPEINDSLQISDKDDVLYSMLNAPQELWSEGSAGFAENNGGEFGGGVKMGYNADIQRLEIFGEDTGACAQFNTSLMTCMSDVGMDKVPQQAVIVKFSASDITKDVRVSFEALDEITFSFRNDGIYFVDVANFFEAPISDFTPNNLELKNDTTYYFFFSFDAEGNIRMFIWEDGIEENQAYFEHDLYQESADINSCDLMMYLGVGPGEQFNIYEYWVYTFDNFMDSSPFVSANGNQNQQPDSGPEWAINVAGNFDVASHGISGKVGENEINIGHDKYTGYRLNELMDFANSGSDKAVMIFSNAGGSEKEVNDTSEAFIVFKKNGEFLGGPFLCYENQCLEYPVIKVQVD